MDDRHVNDPVAETRAELDALMRVLTGAIAAVTFVGIGLEALRRHLADPDGSFGGHDRATVLDSLRAAAARLSDTLRTLDEAARPLIAHGDGVDGDHAR